MSAGLPLVDFLDTVRPTPLYEWTFAILIANLTVQAYRLVAQFTTLLFDIFKLSHGVDLFWPLTTDDLIPFTHYFTNKYEILFKLSESFLLTGIALYGARSLLNGSIVGLGIFTVVFFVHTVLLIIGHFCFQDHEIDLFSMEYMLWATCVILELVSIILTSLFIAKIGISIGLANS